VSGQKKSSFLFVFRRRGKAASFDVRGPLRGWHHKCAVSGFRAAGKQKE
jgi:hypothetical protein